MPYYLLQVCYSHDAWAALVREPEDRQGAIGPVIKKLGGRIVGSWLSFGDYDAIAIVEMPDNVTAAAFSIAVSAAGAVKDIHTTALMTADEALDAMRRAGGVGYTPPGKRRPS
jgi:uncharacterized protein with GYD domain